MVRQTPGILYLPMITYVLPLLLAASLPATSQALTLSAEREPGRILAASGATVDLVPDPDISGEALLAVTVSDAAEGEIEVWLTYQGEHPYVLSRRPLEARNASGTLYWQVLQAEDITSATLSLRGARGASAVVENVTLLPFQGRSLRDRLLAFSAHPVSLLSSAKPIHEDKLGLEIVFPADITPRLLAMDFRVEVHAREGLLASQIATAIPDPGSTFARRTLLIDLPRHVGPLEVRLMVGDEIVTMLPVDPQPVRQPHYEVKQNSIESFSVFERNEELVVYSVVGEHGAMQLAGEAPLLGDAIWLSVGNGAQWVLSEPMLRSSRNIDWLGGGPRDFTIGTIDRNYYGFFTTVGVDGTESLSVASSRDSLRMTPLIQNPVFAPEKKVGDPALWRGNAFFEMNGGKLLLGLERRGARPIVRAIISDLPPRWIDLEEVPVPGLPADALQLSSFSFNNVHYLISGPTPRLWRSEHPLRGWKPMDFHAPQGWENLQLVHWMDRTWLFGTIRHNGRGILTWAPALLKEDSLSVDLEAPFIPKDHKTFIAPQTLLPRSETYVR